jgi:hypothetical protein
MTSATANKSPKCRKAIIVGMIHLTNGRRKAFRSTILYFAARAYYGVRGEILVAYCSVWSAREEEPVQPQVASVAVAA